MIVKRKSAISGIEHQKDIPVDPNDMMMWEYGAGNIDELMPYLTDIDRDFILSGITQNEWTEAFMEET